MIRNRSKDNLTALQCFGQGDAVVSPALSILRQELDSLIRVIYLLSIKDIHARQRLIDNTLRGGKWTVRSANGRSRNVTDREIASLAQKLQGQTKSVYKFGCAFVHLADFHNHFSVNPFDKLKYSEKVDILSYLRGYHDGPKNKNPDILELSLYVPQVFEKVTRELECCLNKLEHDEILDGWDAQPGVPRGGDTP